MQECKNWSEGAMYYILYIYPNMYSQHFLPWCYFPMEVLNIQYLWLSGSLGEGVGRGRTAYHIQFKITIRSIRFIQL